MYAGHIVMGTFAILASMYYASCENFSASTAAQANLLGSAVDYHLFGRNYCCLHSGLLYYFYIQLVESEDTIKTLSWWRATLWCQTAQKMRII